MMVIFFSTACTSLPRKEDRNWLEGHENFALNYSFAAAGPELTTDNDIKVSVYMADTEWYYRYNFGIFADGYLLTGTEENRSDLIGPFNEKAKVKSERYGYGMGCVYSYPLHDNVLIEARLGIQAYKYKYEARYVCPPGEMNYINVHCEDEVHTTSTGISIGPLAGIGFSFPVWYYRPSVLFTAAYYGEDTIDVLDFQDDIPSGFAFGIYINWIAFSTEKSW